jgi:hypothetical protein
MGFETFDGVIDESYDQEYDSNTRMWKIITELKRLNSLEGQERFDMYHKLMNIANRNKEKFDSTVSYNNGTFWKFVKSLPQ